MPKSQSYGAMAVSGFTSKRAYQNTDMYSSPPPPLPLQIIPPFLLPLPPLPPLPPPPVQ
jgi:hypothetical protein